jgi:hypothetical protein
MKLSPADLARRFAKAHSYRQHWEGEWEDAYRYAFPSREPFNSQGRGENRSRVIFDETAVEATQEFASAMAYGLTPSFAEWFRLEPGALAARELNDGQRKTLQEALDEVTAYVFNAIDASDFQPANHEIFLDLALGWSVLWVDESDDPSRLLSFRTLPQNQCYLDLGPGAMPDGRFRLYCVTPEEIRATYGPRARVPMRPDKDAKDNTVTIVDAVYRDWDERKEEVWHRAVWHHENPADGFLWEREYRGYGACPAIVPRWSTTSFEAYGRGPLYNVLPAVRTANLVTQLTLENAEMAIVGMWQADDDGIVNFDSINLLPGTILPRDPESRGLEPLSSPGRFDVSNLVLERMQSAIRRALFNVDLGPMNKTPMSATEAAERQSQLARRIGAPFARLMTEYLSPLIRRAVHILERTGKIELPRVDGRRIQVISRSPLARSQRQEAVLQFSQYDALLKQTFGPTAFTAHKPEATIDYLAQQLEIPGRLRASEDERQAAEQQLMQAMQQAQAPQGTPDVSAA